MDELDEDELLLEDLDELDDDELLLEDLDELDDDELLLEDLDELDDDELLLDLLGVLDFVVTVRGELLFDVLDVLDLRGALVVVLTVDVGVVDTHELAGTTVEVVVVRVRVMPFESIDTTTDSIADVIELHDVVDFFDGFTVDLVVDVGVVETHELAGTTVVFFVVLVCLLPFESVEITSDSITDVIELHDVVDFFDFFGVVDACVVDLIVDVCLGERHELAGTTVVMVVALVCVLPFESIDFSVETATEVDELQGVVYIGCTRVGNDRCLVDVLNVEVGVVDTHELAGTTVVTVVAVVCVDPVSSTDESVDSITDVIDLHDLLGFGDVVERHELSSTIVVTVVRLVCTLPLLSVESIVDAITDGTELHDFFGLVEDRNGTVDEVMYVLQELESRERVVTDSAGLGVTP